MAQENCELHVESMDDEIFCEWGLIFVQGTNKNKKVGYCTDIKIAARLPHTLVQSEIDATSQHITTNFFAGILHIIIQSD